jgi:hypothetical protein
MRPLKIDCGSADWKKLLKRNLQEGIEVELLGLDYEADGLLCEILAISHSMTFRLDFRKKSAIFRKIVPASDPKKGIIALPSPSQG